MNEFFDLRLRTEAFTVLKRPIPLSARFTTTPGTCQTLEGNVRYQPGDAILTGTRGEQWPVRRDLFLAASAHPVCAFRLTACKARPAG